MLKISNLGQRVYVNPFQTVKKILSVIELGGAYLCTYYKDSHEQHYLSYWCDDTENSDRWLLFPVIKLDEQVLRKLEFPKEFDLFASFFKKPKFAYLIDLKHSGLMVQCRQVKPQEVPDYLPEGVSWK